MDVIELCFLRVFCLFSKGGWGYLYTIPIDDDPFFRGRGGISAGLYQGRWHSRIYPETIFHALSDWRFYLSGYCFLVFRDRQREDFFI